MTFLCSVCLAPFISIKQPSKIERKESLYDVRKYIIYKANISLHTRRRGRNIITLYLLKGLFVPPQLTTPSAGTSTCKYIVNLSTTQRKMGHPFLVFHISLCLLTWTDICIRRLFGCMYKRYRKYALKILFQNITYGSIKDFKDKGIGFSMKFNRKRTKFITV